MISSAPIARTMSTFLVLQTAVTCAPNAFAICTANVPTPPVAPLIRTRCPGLELPLVAKTLQRGRGRHGHGRGLLEREPGRLRHQEALRSAAHVFGERARARAVDLIPDPESRHVLADSLDLSRDIDAHRAALRSPEPSAHTG